MTEIRTYEEAVSYLEALPLFAKTKNPGSVARLLDLLGHPEEGFHVIHVAGTNGKGSTCAFLESVFRGMGRKTGLFTSPHLVRINERIRICGREISDDDFLESFLEMQRSFGQLKEEGGQEMTYFEHLFVIALCAFRAQGIELLVCETGMGGRLDVTNAIARVDAVVITSISLDHTQYLGETVEEIAAEKAGIIREGTPVIYSAKDPRSAGVIARRAEEKGAEQIPLTEEDFSITERSGGSIRAVLSCTQDRTLSLHIPFGAEYQAENACLAALCALRLGADPAYVTAGIGQTRWPGRMDEIRPGVFLDGAHNPDGISQIASEIRRAAQTQSVWLLTAIVSDKKHTQMVRELCRGIRYAGVIVTSVGGGRQLDAQTLASEFRAAGQARVEIQADAGTAYRKALSVKGSSVLFCVGSLYLAGEILAIERSAGQQALHGSQRKQCAAD